MDTRVMMCLLMMCFGPVLVGCASTGLPRLRCDAAVPINTPLETESSTSPRIASPQKTTDHAEAATETEAAAQAMPGSQLLESPLSASDVQP